MQKLLHTAAVLVGAIAATHTVAQDAPAFSLAPALAPAVQPQVQAAETSPASGLAPLPVSAADLTFLGETATRTFAFVAQPAQTIGAGSLVLNMRSAVSDDPQNSVLNLALNGQKLDPINLGGATALPISVALPPGLIQPGYNALKMTVDQTHRVDCSLAATYELFTAIDPATSGFAYATTAAATRDWTALLGAVGADSGNTDIRGRLDPGASADDRNLMVRAIQALAIASNADRPKVEFSSAAGTTPGVDVVLGNPQAVAAMLEAQLTTPLQPGVNIISGAGGRVTLAIVEATTNLLNRDINQLVGLGAPSQLTGTPQGIIALAALRGKTLDANRRVTLADLGVDDRTFRGRHFQQAVTFAMPADFYPADYARAGLHLSAFYAPGLANGAHLLFKLNGSTVSTTLLNGSRTGEIRDQVLPIVLSAFRPGLNTLSIEADLPAASDGNCLPGHISDGGGRLQILGSSYLELSDFAEVGRFPDIAAMGNGMTGKSGGTPLEVTLAGDDPAVLNAAGTLLAKLAFTGGRIIDVDVTSAADFNPNAPSLVVGAFADLPASIGSLLNINFSGMAADPGADRSQPGDNNPLATGQPAPDGGLLQGISDTVGSSLSRMRSALRGLGGSFGIDTSSFGIGGGKTFVPAQGTALLVAQRANAAGDAPVTLFAVNDRQFLQAEIDQLVGKLWDSLAGSTMTFSDKGTVLQGLPATGARLFMTQFPSVWNLRLIVAGWLSNNGEIFAFLVLITAALVGLATSLVLWSGRGRTP